MNEISSGMAGDRDQANWKSLGKQFDITLYLLFTFSLKHLVLKSPHFAGLSLVVTKKFEKMNKVPSSQLPEISI